MFDYQAGERYKLTLIMVGAVGVIAGIFITILIAPPSEAPRKKRAMTRSSYDPDVTGIPRSLGGGGGGPAGTSENGGPASQGVTAPSAADAQGAQDFVRGFAFDCFDFSASSAASSQQKAMSMMTPDVAANYQTNVWGPIANDVGASGVVSKFVPQQISAGQANADGSIVIFMQGNLSLQAPDGRIEPKSVNMEYLVQKQADGSMRISGIKEVN